MSLRGNSVVVKHPIYIYTYIYTHNIYIYTFRKRGYFSPVSYHGIAAIMLIDSTSPECVVGNIFLMNGASHFVIIFARATAWNGAKLSAAIGTKLERKSATVDLFPRQDAKFIIRARSLPRDYFLIARQNRGEEKGKGERNPRIRCALTRDWSLDCVWIHFFWHTARKLKKLGIFWDFMKNFALYFVQEYE